MWLVATIVNSVVSDNGNTPFRNSDFKKKHMREEKIRQK